ASGLADAREVQVDLCDRLVVRMPRTIAEAPAVVLRPLQDRPVIDRVAGGVRPAREPDPERGLDPAARVRRLLAERAHVREILEVRELPARYAVACGIDGLGLLEAHVLAGAAPRHGE